MEFCSGWGGFQTAYRKLKTLKTSPPAPALPRALKAPRYALAFAYRPTRLHVSGIRLHEWFFPQNISRNT